MNRQLAWSVLQSFQDDSAESLSQLQRFDASAWRCTYGWLDASGLALYFIDRLNSAGLQRVLPLPVRRRLERNLADNQLRTKDLFAEFRRVNQALERAEVRYANLKGFSVVPEYCRNPALRCQLDLDILIERKDGSRCCEALQTLGYGISNVTPQGYELKAGEERPPNVRELYRPRPQRAVELHFSMSKQSPAPDTCDLLGRAWQMKYAGFTFPALSAPDLFISQAGHLFDHICSEWTRVSWLLEFRNAVRSRHDDVQFWADVRARIERSPQMARAIACASELGSVAFGDFLPAHVSEWTVDLLPVPVRLWFHKFGREILLSRFPGTKRYLILQRELNVGDSQKERRRKLLPLHLPPPVARTNSNKFKRNMAAAYSRLKYILFRLRFHLREGLRYALEVRLWKRILRKSQTEPVTEWKMPRNTKQNISYPY